MKLFGSGRGLSSWRDHSPKSNKINCSDIILFLMKPISVYMEEAGMTVPQLVEASRLDDKTVKAIVSGNYTPSPAQRQRLADALNVAVGDIAWGHTVPVQYLRGNGPQSGRST